jgi:endoglucanase
MGMPWCMYTIACRQAEHRVKKTAVKGEMVMNELIGGLFRGVWVHRMDRCCKSALMLLLSVLVLQSARAQGSGYWHTSGSQIIDSNGDVVRIAGINWYGFETTDYLAHGLWAQDYKTILNTIKSLGFNVVRIPLSNQMVESNPVPTNYTSYANGQPANTAFVGQTALADLDTIVAYTGSIGLRVILDNHRSEAGNSNEANGLWYTSAYPQSNWIADWQTLATRYSDSKFTFNGNPAVIGMDLRNEPHLIANGFSGGCWTGDTETNGSYTGCPTSLTSQNWPVAAEAAGNAVLAINPKLLIIVEGNDCYNGTCGWQGGNLMGVATNPVVLNVPNQLVYSAHDYGPNLYGQPWFNSNTTQSSLNGIWNKFWGYISTSGTAPVWLGEFGTDNNVSDIQNSAAGSQGQWFESLVSYLQSNPSIDWTYWALNGEDSYGLLDSNYDATPVNAQKESMLRSIQFALGGGSSCTASPSAPASLTAAAHSSSSITVHWSAVAPPSNCTINSYSIFRSTTSGFTPSSSNQVASIAGGTSFSDSGLAASTTYYYLVEAVDGNGSSSPSAQASATTNANATCSAVPSAPAGLVATAASSSGINLTWGTVTPPANCAIGSYSVFRNTTSGFTPSSSNQIASGLTGTSFSDSGLTAATTYYYKVEALDGYGASAPSAQASATTQAASSGFSCHVGYSIASQWPGGFEAIMTLTNTSATSISNWTLTWSFANGQAITQLWNGSATQSGPSVTVNSLSYDGNIPGGGSYSGLGFLGTWNNTVNAVPNSFSINGTVCQ